MTRADLKATFAELGPEPEVIRDGFIVTCGAPKIKDVERALLALMPANEERAALYVPDNLRVLAEQAILLADYLERERPVRAPVDDPENLAVTLERDDCSALSGGEIPGWLRERAEQHLGESE